MPEEKFLSQMQAQIDRLLAERSLPDLVQEVLSETQAPFPTSIFTMIPLKNFNMPTIPLYNEKTDLVAHIQIYRMWMNIAKADAPTLCNAFPLTLSGLSQAWFRRLGVGTITNFEHLKEQFFAQFLSSQPQNRGSNYLTTIRQKDRESMSKYLERFDEAVLHCPMVL